MCQHRTETINKHIKWFYDWSENRFAIIVYTGRILCFARPWLTIGLLLNRFMEQNFLEKNSNKIINNANIGDLIKEIKCVVNNGVNLTLKVGNVFSETHCIRLETYKFCFSFSRLHSKSVVKYSALSPTTGAHVLIFERFKT